MKIGIIGGSGLYQIDGFKILEEKELNTPFGEPSDKYIITEYKDKTVIFLPRHGKGHKFPPHLINYRANIWGFRKLGVKYILSISAVGGINPKMKGGDFVIANQFIDFTKSRVSTFYEGIFSKEDDTDLNDKVKEYLNNKRVVHIDVSEPFCPVMKESLKNALSSLNLPFHQNGCYVATEGPRLESSAEIKALSILEADIVGMTLIPELVLARELAIHFASVHIVTNFAAGISENRLTSDEVIEMMKQRNEDIKNILKQFLDNIPSNFNCSCEEVLERAAI
ncbi:S-methyl-5'-thioadenosine phosphorylase [Venenivibrio stagnispumantis]|uniref:Probable 6-oxopurine nucleoside phosphorylase n=1 Tax=Venenivibrio stagnispumantis TaxID=407998 RepID=A0AA45WPT5_9AQUI|nr:S-methyl-5'-thioinosine phosphorylase [Venenivibrio stagnispumantis]MCW4572701.1 S-methyl-5'-thioinosine phosphorylase [Venenivibrio stagnispumantis]SMP22783.1 5'-methylthioadenosine phosphorylase [Venenivibrio stagnispumantis]